MKIPLTKEEIIFLYNHIKDESCYEKYNTIEHYNMFKKIKIFVDTN